MCQHEVSGTTCGELGIYRLVLDCQDCNEKEKTTACDEHLDLVLKAAAEDLVHQRLTNHDLSHRYGGLSVRFLSSRGR